MPEMPLMPVAFGDLDFELDATRRVLARVPADQFDWRPHPKSWPLGSLAAHVAQLPLWSAITIRQDVLDLATLPSTRELPADTDALLAVFDGHVAELRAVLAETPEPDLAATWTLQAGGHTLSQMPRGAMLRTMCVSHLVHHRAQLGVYLRLLDVPLPAIYGPSADEQPGA